MFRNTRSFALLTALVSAAAVAAAQASAFPTLAAPIPDDRDYEAEFNEIVTQFGDVNFDKVVGIADAVQLQRFLLGDTAELGNWKNADFNENGMIDAIDFTMLKQQLAGTHQSGGTLAVGVVDMMTGEPVPDVTVSIGALCDDFGYNLGEWISTGDSVAYYSGLPTDDKYTYMIECRKFPEEYDNGYEFWGQQIMLKFDGKNDLAVNARLVKNDQEPNVHITMYDWALDEEIVDNGTSRYGMLTVRGEDGSCYVGNSVKTNLALPDGNYHVDMILHDYPVTLIDPEGSFAAHMKEIYPDEVFTDTRDGIDFTVKDGKPEGELRFDFGPREGSSNFVKVSCVDGMTGLPLEGVELSVIEAPNHYAKKVASWVSDSTGEHIVDGLTHAGYQWDPPYIVRVDKVPEGYTGGFDQMLCFGYVNGYETSICYSFVKDDLPKGVSATILNFDDGTECNDIATYEIWNRDLENIENFRLVASGIKAGEFITLPDGEYLFAINEREALDNGLNGVSLTSRKGLQLAKFFDLSVYPGVAGMIDVTVKNGKPDRELRFYVKNHDPMENEEDVSPEQMEKYEKLWGSGT